MNGQELMQLPAGPVVEVDTAEKANKLWLTGQFSKPEYSRSRDCFIVMRLVGRGGAKIDVQHVIELIRAHQDCQQYHLVEGRKMSCLDMVLRDLGYTGE